MSETSTVGALTLPVPAAAAAGDKLEDPFIEALLDFAAFYIKDALDTRLAQILPAGSITDACPVANRFSWDPLEPRGVDKKMPLPALFIWWNGDSRRVPYTQLYNYRVRMLDILYVYEERPTRASLKERRGWSNVVDAALHKMSQREAHQNYTPPGGAPGMPVYQALGPLTESQWWYNGGRPGRFGIDEGPLAERRAAKRSGRDWPAVKGTFEVWEKVSGRTLEDPADVLHDGLFAIRGANEGEPVDIMQRVLPAPDGSEEL